MTGSLLAGSLVSVLAILPPAANKRRAEPQFEEGELLRSGFNAPEQIRSNTDGLLLLHLCAPIAFKKCSPSPLEEVQKAKPPENLPTTQQVAPAQSPRHQEEHPRLFWHTDVQGDFAGLPG